MAEGAGGAVAGTVVRRRTKTGAAVERVIERVLAEIATGGLSPGEQLRQEDLAEALGVSRVPVREALYALTEQRVLVHETHRGFFVPRRSEHELAQFHCMLELIEDEVVGSVRWPDRRVLDHLRSLNERMLAAAAGHDVLETAALNKEFHFTIFRLSPYDIMIGELERLWLLAQPHIVARMTTPKDRRQLAEDHDEIIARLAARDRAGLVEATTNHRPSGRAPRTGVPLQPDRGVRPRTPGPVEFRAVIA